MPVRPAGDTHAAGQHLAHAEADRVLKGELYWTSAQMTELASEAAKTMPGFTLAPEDMPSAYGLMAFERPIRTVVSPEGGHAVPITAAAWGLWHPDKYQAGGVWVSWYSDTAAAIDAQSDADMHPNVKAMMKASQPSITYDCESMAPFTDQDARRINPFTGEDASPEALTVDLLKATWLLMQQPLVRTTEIEPDRTVRKRLRRAGQEPKPVRVIELRRPKASSEHGDGDREYHHQWIVRGHWRQQWHPKREVHRPVWIAPHIKGPEGAPLIGGEKVYAWKR
jgi:hypothetical protein